MVRPILFLLGYLAWLVDGQARVCPRIFGQPGCVCQHPDGVINLTEIANNTGSPRYELDKCSDQCNANVSLYCTVSKRTLPQWRIMSIDPPDIMFVEFLCLLERQYTYDFNPCYTFTTFRCNYVYICQSEILNRGSTFSIANENEHIMIDPSDSRGQIYLHYTGPPGRAGIRNTTVYLHCDQSRTTPIVTAAGEITMLNYVFNLYSCAACPGGCVPCPPPCPNSENCAAPISTAEWNITGCPIDVTPTCAALQSLTESAQYLRCNRNDQCDAVHCNVTYSLFQSHVSMINFTIMPCNLPPSVWVSGSNESGGIVLDLVTNHSQNIPVIDEVSLTISVVQLTNAIGFEVNAIVHYITIREPLTIVPYIRIPIDTSECSNVTPTCAAMQSLTENARYLNCSSNDQCDTVHCIVTFSLLQSLLSMVNFTLLPCNLPPTVRLSASNESGSVVLDLVLNETQNVPLINGVILNASVFQLTKAIGFEVNVLVNDITKIATITAVPYTRIPIDTSGCSISVLTCGAPVLASGVIGRYNTTTVSSEVFYQCQKAGFAPSEPRSKCGEDVRWTPDPSQVVCKMMTPKEYSVGIITGAVGGSIFGGTLLLILMIIVIVVHKKAKKKKCGDYPSQDDCTSPLVNSAQQEETNEQEEMKQEETNEQETNNQEETKQETNEQEETNHKLLGTSKMPGQTNHRSSTSTIQPTSSSSTATVATTSASATTTQQSNKESPLGMNDLVDVSVYLNLLKRDQIFELGVVLGLRAVPTLDKLRYTQTFLCDMLAAWLQGMDDVNKRGGHTWKALVNALKRPSVNQTEIADKIQRDKCHTH